MPDLKKMLTLEALSEALPSWLKRSTKPEYNADEIDSTLTTNQFVTASDKENWNAKGTYSKPSGGIPKSDLSSIVQTSLEKADSALQSETDPTVPSWAKASSKPSYTQDEVPDGTTYKRVSQTEKDTWSGKQNALTTTQMQAVNSGITSAGVAQIGTNETNIYYALDACVINIVNAFNTSENGMNSVVGSNRYSVTISGTPTGDRVITWGKVKPIESGNYVITFSFSTNGAFYIYDVTTGTQIIELTQSSASPYVLNMDATHEYELRTWYSVAVSFTLSIMIVLKRIYDGYELGGYVPFALPNRDLTVLESEDRAGLAEVVDSGAKNLLDISGRITDIKSQNPGGTWTGNSYAENGVTFTINNDGTIDVSGQNTTNNQTVLILINRLTGIKNIKEGNYALSGCPANGSQDKYRIYAYNAKTTSPKTSYADDGNGVVGYFNYSAADTEYPNIAIVVAANYSITGTLKFKPMLCTKAAFDVSQKFVPFTKSNYELAQEKLNKCSKLLSSGSLNNIKDNEIYYASSDVTGMPSISRMWGFVRTTMYGDSTGIQEFFSVTEPIASYVRVLRQNVWQPWKQLGASCTTYSITPTAINTWTEVTRITIPANCIVKITASIGWDQDPVSGIKLTNESGTLLAINEDRSSANLGGLTLTHIENTKGMSSGYTRVLYGEISRISGGGRTRVTVTTEYVEC